jgi:general secretion pathway protein D
MRLRRLLHWSVLLLVTASFANGQPAPTSSDVVEQAQAAEKAGDYVRAYLLYARAAAINPKNRLAWNKSIALRTKAALAAKIAPPSLGSLPDDPAPLLSDVITAEDLRQVRELLPPPELQPDPGRKTLNLQGSARTLLEQVGKAYGLTIFFDADFQDIQNLKFNIEDATAAESLEAIEWATASFYVPISEKIALAARDTVQKRNDLEPNVAVIIPLPAATSAQEITEIGRAVQQLLDIRRFSIDTRLGQAILADRVSKVRAAQLMFQQISKYQPQVVIEVELLEVTENYKVNFGLNPTSQQGFLVNWLQRSASLSAPGLGFNFFGLGAVNAQLFANFSRTSGRTLLRGELRSVSGQAAELHVGDKYPIITNRYLSGDPADDASTLPPPTFQFQDLGMNIKVTPLVNGSHEVTLVVESDFKVLTGQIENDIPVIAERFMSSTIRLKEGEWAVLAGLVRGSESKSVSGTAGLMQIPALGILFSNQAREKGSGQTLFILKPHIIDVPPNETLLIPMRSGSLAKPRSPI